MCSEDVCPNNGYFKGVQPEGVTWAWLLCVCIPCILTCWSRLPASNQPPPLVFLSSGTLLILKSETRMRITRIKAESGVGGGGGIFFIWVKNRGNGSIDVRSWLQSWASPTKKFGRRRKSIAKKVNSWRQKHCLYNRYKCISRPKHSCVGVKV